MIQYYSTYRKIKLYKKSTTKPPCIQCSALEMSENLKSLLKDIQYQILIIIINSSS